MGFSFMQVHFTNTKLFFLREKSKWNGKLENGSGLKNAAVHLWIKKESNDNLRFEILLMS